MSEENKEHLSAFMDDENGEHEKKVVDRLLKEPGLMNTWTRYHLISDCINRRLPGRLDPHLADRVSRSLQDEPQVVAPVGFPGSFIRPVGGLAIAASVAALAIFGIQQQQLGGPGGPHEMPGEIPGELSRDTLAAPAPEVNPGRVAPAPVMTASGRRAGDSAWRAKAGGGRAEPECAEPGAGDEPRGAKAGKRKQQSGEDCRQDLSPQTE